MARVYRSNSLTEDEQVRLIQAADTFEDLALFKLALTTGIRREDIANIELSGVDIENRVISFYESKKSRVWRVPLNIETAQTIKRYINTLPKNQKNLFRFTGRTAYNRLQKYLKKAGITNKQISFHDLRRSMMKTAKKKGMDIKALSQITGDTVRTIESFYQNLTMEELQEQAEKL